jgi:hypothetical protein
VRFNGNQFRSLYFYFIFVFCFWIYDITYDRRMHVHAYDILSGFMPRSKEPYLSSDFDMDTLFLLEEQITPCPTS